MIGDVKTKDHHLSRLNPSLVATEIDPPQDLLDEDQEPTIVWVGRRCIQGLRLAEYSDPSRLRLMNDPQKPQSNQGRTHPPANRPWRWILVSEDRIRSQWSGT